MKTIILESTLIAKQTTQEEFIKLVEGGYKLKEVKNVKYLIKDEVL